MKKKKPVGKVKEVSDAKEEVVETKVEEFTIDEKSVAALSPEEIESRYQAHLEKIRGGK